MLAFLKLTRPLNLLIMALTMFAMRYGVIGGYLRHLSAKLAERAPALDTTVIATVPHNLFLHAFDRTHFILLVISVMLIAAGGNVINDYFDTRIDRINKPDEVIVGRSVKRRVAMAAHLVFSALGILIGAFVAWRAGQLKLAIIPVFAVAALWFYSVSLKRKFIIGNATVSFLSALVPLTVALYEIPALVHAYPPAQVKDTDGMIWEADFDFSYPMYCVLAYAAFAFITTLVRELQKDLADVKGDEADGCRTVPIVWGMRAAKTIVLVYIAVTVITLLVVRMAFLHDPLSFWTIGFGVLGPLLLSAGFTFNAEDRRAYMTAANLMKAAMVVAVLYAFFIERALS